MRRLFTSTEAQQTYDGLMQSRPARVGAIIDTAFYYGYENPYSEGLPDLCGKPGSATRAAWAAGVDSRRLDARLSGNRPLFFRGELARHG